MANKKKLHVVNLIPTYNEAENVLLMLETLEEIAKKNPQYAWSTLVVDDNSPDGTGELVSEYQTKLSKLQNDLAFKKIKSIASELENIQYQVFLLRGNKQGLGNALIRGYQYAIEKLRADIIVSNDCDFQFDPKDILRLLEKIDQGFDVVVASRHTPGGKVENWPKGRHLTHWVANYVFATLVAGTREVTDHNGNFRAMRVKGVLDKMNLKKVKTKGYGFLNYIIYLLSKTGAKFTEIPVTFKWRERGETKVSFTPKYFKTFFRDTVEYVKLCIWIRLDRMKIFV